MGNLWNIIVEGGVPIVAILLIGALGVGIIVERVHALYFRYTLDSKAFIEKIKGYIMADKISEATKLADSHAETPLGKVTKAILERSNRDDESIQQALDISMAESIPLLTRRLGYLSMISNVATLIGLLGTIYGLIMSFEAVSFADPSQKQTLLAQGISMSMNTTAFGLAVAIPVMIFYAFLHARQNALVEDLGANTAKVIDVLSARNYQGFNTDELYPSQLGIQTMKDIDAPPPSNKAA